MALPKPDYLSRDYTSLRQSMLQYGQQVFPEWNPASEGDFGMVMVEMFAYMGDILSYYTDRAQFENYLPTATQRDSILNIAFMLGYSPGSGYPASGTVQLTLDKNAKATVIPPGTQITTNRVDALDGPIVFETQEFASETNTIPANPTGTAAPVVVPVIEGTTETFRFLGSSTGMPSQVMRIPNTGVYRDTIQVYVEDQEGDVLINEGTTSEVRVREWVIVDRLLAGDGADKIVETRYTTTSTLLYFGDDINGAIPATGLRVYATYRHGVGAQGNIGPGLVRLVNTKGVQSLGVVKVAKDSNGVFLSSEMTGGADPESDDSIRRNAPRVYRTQDRVVTEKDFVEVALGTEGVSAASAVVGSFTSVTLFIVGPDGGPPSDALKQAVMDRLEGKTLAGVSVSIGAPTFVPVLFGKPGSPIRVTVRKGHSLNNVRVAIRRAIRQYVARMEYGAPLSVSSIYKVIDRVHGTVNVDIDVMVRQDAVSQTGTARITPKAWEMFNVGGITLDVVRHTKEDN